MQSAIQVENLSKRYWISAQTHGRYRTLRESLSHVVSAPWRRLRPRPAASATAEPPRRPLWAINDVSFGVPAGQVLGLIGRNGAGKSTLLKMLSKITEPTSGRIELRGRVASLLEVGTGFHFELSGRENIFLNGAMLGMTRREIIRKFDDIVDFADVGQFIDTPVKRYSSGMFVRLAFAVASHLEPDVLVVDEVLAVGDQEFQKRCLGKMDEVGHSGRTVLLVSHNMAAVQNLCRNVVLLESGKLRFAGDAATGIQLYLNEAVGDSSGQADLTQHRRRRPGSQPILTSVELVGCGQEGAGQFRSGEPWEVELTAEPPPALSDVQFGIEVEDVHRRRLFTVGTFLSQSPSLCVRRPMIVRCRVAELPLAPGKYHLTVHAGPTGRRNADRIEQAVSFEVVNGDFYGNGWSPRAGSGSFLVRSQWRAEGRP